MAAKKTSKAKTTKKKTTKKATAKKTKRPSVKKAVKKVVKKAAKRAVHKVAKKISDKISAKPQVIEVTVRSKFDKGISEEHHFYVRDGRRLKTVLDLIDALDEMADDVFEHHVKEDNNDFANWIHHVLDEEKLAHDIKKAEDKVEMQFKLMKHALDKIVKE